MNTDIDTDCGNGDRRGLRPGALAGGALLLILGATLLLDQAGVVAAPLRQLIAPLVLIGLGALIVVEKGTIVYSYRQRDEHGRPVPVRPRGNPGAGLWLMEVGVWMLISQLHLWGLAYRTSWPLLVILSGVMMLVRGIR